MWAQPAALDPAGATNAFAVAALRTEPRIAWEVTPRYRDSSALALGNGVLVTGNTSGQGGTFGYDAATGKQLWSVPGHIRGGPAIAGAFAYAVNDLKDRNRFALRKLDLRTGKAAWSAADDDLGNHDGPPVVVAGVVALTSRNRSVSAYDVGTGTRAWQHAGVHLCVGQVSAAAGLVFVSGGLTGTDHTLSALDAVTGATVWSTLLTAADEKGCGSGTAVVDGIVVTGLGRQLLAFDARTGARKWVRMVASTVAGRRQEAALTQLVVTGGVVYSATSTALTGTDLESGRAVFDLALPAPLELDTIRMVAARGLIYVHGNPVLAAGRGPATLYALELAERHVLWTHAAARKGQYDLLGSWTTRYLLPVEGGLVYENSQLLVRLQP